MTAAIDNLASWGGQYCAMVASAVNMDILYAWIIVVFFVALLVRREHRKRRD